MSRVAERSVNLQITCKIHLAGVTEALYVSSKVEGVLEDLHRLSDMYSQEHYIANE